MEGLSNPSLDIVFKKPSFIGGASHLFLHYCTMNGMDQEEGLTNPSCNIVYLWSLNLGKYSQ